MPTAHITTADPLNFATAGVINLKSITPSTPKGFVEVLGPDGLYIASALFEIRPLQQFELVYELLATASLTVAFGIAVNTDYLVTAFSCACAPEKYPTVTLTAIKPTNVAMIKAYANAVSLTAVGGKGIVNKWGATSTASFVSSQCSVSMQSMDVPNETSGDFETDGIYRYGFKQECSAEAYAAITTPVGAHAVPNAPAGPVETAEDMQKYVASWWTYMDAA